ncbi:MAG: endolytic transglycosylase MltG [Caldisericota bacterium]|nr:endolytic transglycosylase MltG [Caldisericota bacterium]
MIIFIEVYPGLITGKSEGELDISENVTAKNIGTLLKENSFILDPIGFSIIVRVKGEERNLKSGHYFFTDIHSIFDIIDILKQGVLPEDIKVTIPEGFTVRDITERLYENNVIEDKELFIKEAEQYEGYLFPDTYSFTEKMANRDVINRFGERFLEILPADINEKAMGKNLTLEQVIILASIVEKEVRLDEDRPLAASVFLNRMRVGMSLQADSTIVYILPGHKQWLSEEDYDIDSPYNTYKYAGLPPRPICNPGIKSIIAVLDAPDANYYYFITTPEGKAIFERTLEEHNRDLLKYYGG